MTAIITLKDTPNAVPIAQVNETNEIIYMKEAPEQIRQTIKHNKNRESCGYCHMEVDKKETYLYHLKNMCLVYGKKVQENSFISNMEISPIPQEMHNIIFVSGAPRSGKTYWVNMYSTMYSKIFGRQIFYFTRNQFDESLNEDLYTKILTSSIKKPIELETLSNSLCIFDDIEDSQYPKVTKYLYNLMDDIIKNGRHAGDAGISIIFCNQETTMYRRTKTILSQMSEFVFFPNFTSKRAAIYVLEAYLGLSAEEIKYIYRLPTRWIMVRRISPQYFISQHNIMLLYGTVHNKKIN